MEHSASKRRKVCRRRQISEPSSPSSPRTKNAPVTTPRRSALLRDAVATAGKLPRTKLFEKYKISESTGYRILRSGQARQGPDIHKRGRKQILQPHELEAIETVEDATFRFSASTHVSIARHIGIEKGSERAIQRNMSDFGVKTYMSVQKIFLLTDNRRIREIWGFERRYWKKEDFRHYKYSDESHFACEIQRQARVHRRRGTIYRYKPIKVQYYLKRKNTVWHVFGYIGYNYKSTLHFYKGTGKRGALVQKDYLEFLRNWIAPTWEEDWVLLEDNDSAHGTRGEGDNQVKRLKEQLKIRWESNPPCSPDLNPIEKIWRSIKQRLKNRGVIWTPEDLKQAILEEWDKITLEEINRQIDSMPERVEAVSLARGGPTPF